jgi:hypothetical protein
MILAPLLVLATMLTRKMLKMAVVAVLPATLLLLLLLLLLPPLLLLLQTDLWPVSGIWKAVLLAALLQIQTLAFAACPQEEEAAAERRLLSDSAAALMLLLLLLSLFDLRR